MLKSFLDYLIEADEKKENYNEHFGKAYEIATALHVHSMSGSKNNQDPEHKKRIAQLNKEGKESHDKLPEHLAIRANKAAHSSAVAYLKSLKDNHGIDAKDVHEVHHTSKGISHLTGKDLDRIQNPHDIAIKTKSGKLHGASLKATKGTLSNNGIGSIDKAGEKKGVKTNLSKVWEDGKKKAGLAGKSNKEIKEKRDDPKVKEINKETQAKAAQHHANAFNSSSPQQKREHLKHIMKADKPDVPYDYVNGEKGKSTPSHELPHTKSIEKSKDFKATAEKGSNLVKIHDSEGNHLATVEHRPTHGAFSGIQVNTKIGTVK
jgi:hypothetical protein